MIGSKGSLLRHLLLVAFGIAMLAAHAAAQAGGGDAPTIDSTYDGDFGMDADSTWNGLDTLNPEDFRFDSDLIGHYSHGWFPAAQRGMSLSFQSTLFYADVYDAANGIRPSSFRSTTAPFGWRNPYGSGEQKILQPNSDKESEDGYPATSYEEYIARFTYNLPMPAVLRFGAGLTVTQGLLFSNDTTRSYLGLNGAMQPLKEVGVAYLSEYLLTGSAGVTIPFYGVFVESEAATVASYYYLHLGISAAYSVSSRLTQYAQIANAKGELRYGNGADTVTLLYRSRPGDLERMRTSIDVALGWNFAIEIGTVSFELFGSYPLKSVLTDADWKQYYVGMRGAIGYQWLPERKNKH
jgi:hypothetical protein